MKILYVAYPLLTVSEESAGGAEQMLWTLERFPHPERSEGTLSIEKASMKVLYVACPLLTLSEESAGGAEQMLWTLER